MGVLRWRAGTRGKLKPLLIRIESTHNEGYAPTMDSRATIPGQTHPDTLPVGGSPEIFRPATLRGGAIASVTAGTQGIQNDDGLRLNDKQNEGGISGQALDQDGKTTTQGPSQHAASSAQDNQGESRQGEGSSRQGGQNHDSNHGQQDGDDRSPPPSPPREPGALPPPGAAHHPPSRPQGVSTNAATDAKPSVASVSSSSSATPSSPATPDPAPIRPQNAPEAPSSPTPSSTPSSSPLPETTSVTTETPLANKITPAVASVLAPSSPSLPEIVAPSPSASSPLTISTFQTSPAAMSAGVMAGIAGEYHELLPRTINLLDGVLNPQSQLALSPRSRYSWRCYSYSDGSEEEGQAWLQGTLVRCLRRTTLVRTSKTHS